MQHGRNPNFTGFYDIYLYDKWQAERLEEYLNGFGFAVSVARIELPVSLKKKETRKRGPKAKMSAEQARLLKNEREKERRKNLKLKKKIEIVRVHLKKEVRRREPIADRRAA